MATYVLIHGTYQGGWVWKRVAEGLRAAGHLVYHPTLDGCGERKYLLRAGITLDTWGSEVANLLFYEDLTDVILVGTSSGGMVVARAAEMAPERVGRLVFISALAPLPDETSAIINNRPPYDRSDIAYGPQPETARGNVFADLEPEIQEWALARYTRQPIAPTNEPAGLQDFWARKWHVDVLRCSRSHAPPESHERRTAELLGGAYTELDSGHYPMLSHPDEVIAYLLAKA